MIWRVVLTARFREASHVTRRNAGRYTEFVGRCSLFVQTSERATPRMSLYDLSANAVRRLYDSRIDTPPVLDTAAYFPGAARFVSAWQVIRDEALSLSSRMQAIPRFHEIMPAQAEISANDGKDWRLLILKVYGTEVEKNTALCPKLAELVSANPDVLSASLSFLGPHKHIPRHRGPFRGILRYQLGLSVPVDEQGRPAAVLALNDVEHRVGDGEELLWDDTYPHEVWNHSDQMRLVLLLDVRRPNMPFDLRVISRALIASVGMVARVRGVA
jgi:aspartate beta-hydroxylase